jgi:hypothetical protein
MDGNNLEVSQAFLEYVVHEKAREESLTVDGVSWVKGRSNGHRGPASLSLIVEAGGSLYGESFTTEEVMNYLTHPRHFHTVSNKLSLLLRRMREAAVQSSIRRPSLFAESTSSAAS